MKLDHLIAPINLGALPPDQFLLAQACARRAKNLALMMARLDQRVKVIELHPDVLSADFAVLHLRRSYDLKKLLQSDNLAFIEEFPVSYTHLTLPTIHVECRSRWARYH